MFLCHMFTRLSVSTVTLLSRRRKSTVTHKSLCRTGLRIMRFFVFGLFGPFVDSVVQNAQMRAFYGPIPAQGGLGRGRAVKGPRRGALGPCCTGSGRQDGGRWAYRLAPKPQTLSRVWDEGQIGGSSETTPGNNPVPGARAARTTTPGASQGFFVGGQCQITY